MARQPKTQVGETYGRLTIIGIDPTRTNKNKAHKRICQCSCGKLKMVISAHLASGETQSCGCLQKERASASSRTHGQTRTKAYSTWVGMKTRCYNKKDKEYNNYGGRGIYVSDAWQSFENFFSSMGEKPVGKSLERKDNNGPYSEENCIWASLSTQSRNKRTTHFLTLEGTTLCMKDWSKKLGMNYGTLCHRIRSGWSVERALTTPVKTK